MRCFAYTALLATAAASPALAQEGAPFTGPRVEGLVGYDRVQTDTGHDGALGYGAAVGYDMQMGRAIVGLDAEIGDSNARSCIGSSTAADPRACVKTGRDLYAGGRIGTVVGGSTLLYAKAGYTNAQAKLTSNDGTGQITLDKTNLNGVRLGAGVEHAVSRNSFVKAEYRYSNYERGVERHQAMAGVGFRF